MNFQQVSGQKKKPESETSCIMIIQERCQFSLASVRFWTNLEPLGMFWAISASKFIVFLCLSFILFCFFPPLENRLKIIEYVSCSLLTSLIPLKIQASRKGNPTRHPSIGHGKFNEVLLWHLDFHWPWETCKSMGKLGNGNNDRGPWDLQENVHRGILTLPVNDTNEPATD